jgi:hypothetical protein
MGLLSLLFGRRGDGPDGSSPEKAIVAHSVGAEYEWMRRYCPGWMPVMQRLMHIDGKPYDQHTLQNDRGEERTLYFDISSFFGKF